MNLHHFQKYKQGALRVVLNLELLNVTPLIPGAGVFLSDR